MTPSTNFATLPSDVCWTVFSNIPNAEPATLNLVCRSWHSLFKKDNESEANSRFWKPIFLEMFSKNVQEATNKEVSPNFQAVVKTFFMDSRANFDFIVDLIKDDQQLAICLHSNDWKLEEFKAKPALLRSRIIWKALHHDATPVLVMLQEKWMPAYYEVTRGFIKSTPTIYSSCIGDNREFEQGINDCLTRFKSSEKFSPIILSLIGNNVPYNKVDFIYALLKSIKMNDHALNFLYKIAKSHEDLSGLHKITINVAPGIDCLASQHLITICRTAQDRQITEEDLIRCKLTDQN